MAAKLATGTAMNEDVTVLLQGGALKNKCGIFSQRRVAHSNESV
jgi:hypothetical protein